MYDISNIILFSAVVVSIELYSEIHLKNYGSLAERLIYLFGIKTLFNILKLSLIFSFSYVVFKLDGTFDFLSTNFINDKILKIDFQNIWQYFITPLSVAIFIILFNSKELYNHFRVRSLYNEKLNQFIANLKYLFLRLFSYIFTFAIITYILKYTIKLDRLFQTNELSVMDWLTFTKSGQDNYNKGIYFSLLLTIIIFIVFNNSFIKRNSDSWNYKALKLDFFKYFFITIILCIGLFFGFFSIFNGVYNILNSSISEWFSKENILGILPIRVSSLLIIVHLLSYIYKEVLDRKISAFLILGLLPIRNIQNYNKVINFESRETLFFSQISFYILNIALAELFIMVGFKNNYLGLLNFAILFILDDFIIITEYSKNLRSVLPSHFFRIWIFNIIMLVVSIVLLLNKDYHILLGSYIFITMLLFLFYSRNSRSINLNNPI